MVQNVYSSATIGYALADGAFKKTQYVHHLNLDERYSL